MGHAKFMDYMGPVQMKYRARTFSTYINNGDAHCLENIYIQGEYFFIYFYALFLH